MGLFSRRKPVAKPEMSRAEALAYRPVVSQDVLIEHTDGGLVRISYPVALRPFIAGMARRLGRSDAPMRRVLELDEMGSTVWGWLDGRSTAQQLAAMLAARYGLHEREAEVSMAAYLRELGRRGIIGLSR